MVTGEDDLREVIPFPKTQTASELLFNAPSKVEMLQLDNLHSCVTKWDRALRRNHGYFTTEIKPQHTAAPSSRNPQVCAFTLVMAVKIPLSGGLA